MPINTFRLVAFTAAASLTSLAINPSIQADAATGRNTADTVSMDPSSPNYYGEFAPELPATVARKPELDPATGMSVQEVKPGLFFVTDGIYNSAFLVTSAGIVVFDSPLTYADRLPALIAQSAPGQPITTLIYSHDHADHIGSSGAFADVPGLEVITSGRIADSLRHEEYPGVLAPTRTFEGELDLSIGGVEIELETASYHSEDEDVLAYIPDLKFLMAVDTITPGEVPFMNFGATSDYGRYLEAFDTLLAYDFDLVMSGHISIPGTRQDMIDNRDYTRDVNQTVLGEMETMFPQFEDVYAATGYVNGNLAYRMAIESMRDACATQIIDRWSERLSVVDIYADSHCETAIVYYIMH